MATLIGVLLDVSGSMRSSIGGRPNTEGGSWARSIFEVVNGLIKHDVSSSNHVFALGCGASRDPHAFDLLNTMEIAADAESSSDYFNQKSLEDILEEILTILEENGAPRVRRWARMSVLLDVVQESEAWLLHQKLSNNADFRRKFVYTCLPKSCLDFSISTEVGFSVVGFFGGDGFQDSITRGSVREVISKGLELMTDVSLAGIGPGSVMDVHKASKILHGRIGENELTDQRVDELMKTVEPFIYGGTPLMKTINEAKKLFATRKYINYNKLMFILSDGQPSDGNNPPVDELADLGVVTVCCYITNSSINDPKRLYSTECTNWDTAAKLMFRMSSTITTQIIPRTIFLNRNWTIDTTNNETRLFVQVNHPEIIKDVCDLARDVVCCQDVLSDLLSSVNLDLYINQANQGFRPQEQVGGTCYANASATVLHLSMHRIVGREGGYPNFFDLREKIIRKYGKHGANTLKVLQEVCPEYRLHCQEVDVLGAMKAVTAKRPVVARFYLTDAEWDIFSKFYDRYPRGILTSSILNTKQRSGADTLSGHAVVLTGFNSESLRLMNSWGSKWADGGFFRIASADVLGLQFFDVFWTLRDLKQSEKDEYKRSGPRIAQEMISKLKGLKLAQHTCPLCRKSSPVSRFTGHLLEAKCPECQGRFNINDTGNDLALNLYLLSLSARA